MFCAVSGTEIVNRVHYFVRGPFDIWLMRQRQETLEGEDATFVEVRIQPEALMRFVDEHSGRSRK